MSTTERIIAQQIPDRAENAFGAMDRIVESTPDGGEGGRFHTRSEFAWEIREDYRRAVVQDPRVLADYDEDYTYADIQAECVRQAARAVASWTRQDSQDALLHHEGAMSTITYSAEGESRGSCGHAHHTYAAAARCVERDARVCRRLRGGAYSDRHVQVTRDGVPLAWGEIENCAADGAAWARAVVNARENEYERTDA